MLMMYVGLFYMTGRGLSYMAADSPMHWILMPVNILPSIYFFGAWGQRIVIIGLCVVHQQNIELFRVLLRIFTCGRSSPDQFYVDHIALPGEVAKKEQPPQSDVDLPDFSHGEDESSKQALGLDDSDVGGNVVKTPGAESVLALSLSEI